MERGLTYEKLFDCLREERNNVQLQKLSDSFYEDAIAYISLKEDLVNSEKLSNPVLAEGSIDQLKNARKIIENIYERREKKMLLLALHKSRTKSQLIDTGSLLPEERIFFKQLTILLNHFREEILLKILKKELPIINSTKDALLIDDTSVSDEDIFSKKSSEEDISPLVEKSLSEGSSITKNASNLKPVKILSYIDKFVGPDLDILGPFEEGAVEKLPEEVIQLLLEKGLVELV